MGRYGVSYESMQNLYASGCWVFRAVSSKWGQGWAAEARVECLVKKAVFSSPKMQQKGFGLKVCGVKRCVRAERDVVIAFGFPAPSLNPKPQKSAKLGSRAAGGVGIRASGLRFQGCRVFWRKQLGVFRVGNFEVVHWEFSTNTTP